MSRIQDSSSDDSSDEERDSLHAQELCKDLDFIKEQLAKHTSRQRRFARELVAARSSLNPDEGDEADEADEADEIQLQNLVALETKSRPR